MLRRRVPSPGPPEASAPAGPVGRAGGPDLAGDLEAAGWALPRGLRDDGPPRWTLVGTVASPTATPVDRTGLVIGEGWSLDWWVGADDRWHLPVREAAVRQHVLDRAPVVETLLRVPGGDAVHRAYGIRSPRPVGDEWVVAEIENRTPVPFAVALVVRPLVADAVGAVSSVTVEPVGGGRGRDVAHLVRVDGRPALVLPRRPARVAAGDGAADVVEVVTAGEAGADLVAATSDDGLATLALVLPLPHTAVLRVALPVGDVGDDPVDYPTVLPDAATVAAGWEIHRRGPRFEPPDRTLADALARARAEVHLAHDGEAVRRDGHRSPDLEPGATEVLLGAFDLLDLPGDVGSVVARWVPRLADPAPDIDAIFLRVVARHWSLHRADALLAWMLPEVAAAVERLDRAHRRGRLSPAGQWRAADALRAAAAVLARAGQPEAAPKVARLAERIERDLPRPEPTTAAERLALVARTLELDPGDGDATWAEVEAVLVAASPTGTWPGPGPGNRPLGHDLAASAALVAAVRYALVAERPDGIDLLTVHPSSWYGGGIEVHDAPTGWGRLSYAVRWHGTRPALLWELEPHDGADRAPVLRSPALDPAWSSRELRGEALLAEVAPPAGADRLTLVAEHPDIDPAMRRPGQVADTDPGEIAEGGTFS